MDYHTKWHFYGSLNLLLTCRQIYTETKLLPLSLNTFAGHETGLDLRLHQAFEDWQFEAIGSIRVHMSAASLIYIFFSKLFTLPAGQNRSHGGHQACLGGKEV
jgi:hypothetical protein